MVSACYGVRYTTSPWVWGCRYAREHGRTISRHHFATPSSARVQEWLYEYDRTISGHHFATPSPADSHRWLRHLAHPSHALEGTPSAASEARAMRVVTGLLPAPALRSLRSQLARGSFHSPLAFRGTPFGRPSQCAGPDLNLTHSTRFARSVPCLKSAPALLTPFVMRGTGFEPADSYETAS